MATSLLVNEDTYLGRDFTHIELDRGADGLINPFRQIC